MAAGAIRDGRKTHYTVGPTSSNDAGGPTFHDVKLSRDQTVRVMNPRVFDGALRAADKVLRDLQSARKT